VSAGGGTRAILAALGANAGIAVAKFVGFAITGSASMLAEAVHSVADTSNQGLLLLGQKTSRRKATEEHPFGFGRDRYFYSFIVALMLFSLGAAFAIYEGVHKLQEPEPLTAPIVAVIILLVAIVLEAYSFRTAMVESAKIKGSVSWWGFIRQSRSPELPVVLLEDSGALVGLTFALVGVILAKVTDNGRWDALGSLAIGILLCTIALFLAREMKGLLIGEAAEPEIERRIVAAINGSEDVHKLIHLRTQHLGPDELLVGAKLEFDGDLTVRELSRAIDATEANIRSEVPIATIIYLEPDIRRESADEPSDHPAREAAQATDDLDPPPLS